MPDKSSTAADQYRVVVNEEEQYSILREQAAVPAGWVDAGFVGSEEECVEHVDRVWPDIRPLSIRRSLGLTTGTPNGGLH
jgi:MbtH protein